MTKPIPRMRSRRNGRIGLRKSTHNIPKRIIHVQAILNNTIVTVTDVQGRVISWSSAGTYGFKGTRRGTLFAAQTAAGTAIRTVVDQGMQRAEVMITGPGLERDTTLRAILNLIDLFIPFLHVEEENFHLTNSQHKMTLPIFTFHDRLAKLRKNKKEIAFKFIFIDQSELPPRIYNCLKRSNIHTLLDLLNNNTDELMKIKNLRIEDINHILNILEIEKHFILI